MFVHRCLQRSMVCPGNTKGGSITVPHLVFPGLSMVAHSVSQSCVILSLFLSLSLTLLDRKLTALSRTLTLFLLTALERTPSHTHWHIRTFLCLRVLQAFPIQSVSQHA
jgi:hypothetical protein